MIENEDQDDTWEQYQMKRDEAFARAIAQISRELREQGQLRGLYFAGLILTLTMNTCITAGCVTSPMEEWRDDVQALCVTAGERLQRGCAVPSRLDCGAELTEAEAAGCMGPLEQVLACWAREDVVVACNPWGPDIGSQCDAEEWELRTCIYPELRQ